MYQGNYYAMTAEEKFEREVNLKAAVSEINQL